MSSFSLSRNTIFSIAKVKISVFLKKKPVTDIFSMAGANLALRPFQLIKGFVVAKFLGPYDYGILKSVEMILMLNKFGNLGFNATVLREAGAALGNDDFEKARVVKNIAFTGELLLAFTLFIIGLSISLFFDSKVIVAAIIIASISLFFAKLNQIFVTTATLQKKFKLIGKISFVQGVINSIAVIATVPFLKIYSVLAIPILSAIVSILIFVKVLGIQFSFKIEMLQFKKILKISVPLTMGGLSYGLFKYTERFLILNFLGVIAVGFWSFADMITGQFVTLFLMSIKVRKMTLYEALGKGDYKSVGSIVKKESGFQVLAALVIIPVIWISLDILVPLFLDKWVDSIKYAKLLLITLPIKCISSYASVVISSSVVNKLKVTPILRAGSTLFLLISVYTMNHLKMLTLYNFLVVDILAYSFHHLLLLFFYKKYFCNVYLTRNLITK